MTTSTDANHHSSTELQSVNGQDEVPVVYHYDSYGRVDTLYDESGLVCYQYGNMGEITRETRIYTVPFLSNIIALSTQFEYDSWGRILNITYPDNEIVSYEYDCGGQLFKFYNNQNYTYLDSVQYNKFGAKTSQLYGNGIKTKYTYYPLTQRLDSLLTTCSGNTLSYLQYNYDSIGNIIRVNSSYPMPQYQVTERYSYDSADQLLSAESTCNNNVLCSGAYSYNNWGKINTYTQQTTDPATNTSENKDYRYYFPSNSSDMAQGQTSFAPIIKYDMQQNTQPLETCTYGINGSIRKRVDNQTQNADYYYYNTSGNLKACGTDMQISLYGYNFANTRTYKVNMFNANQWVNGQPQPIQPMVQSAMFYPNTYLNFTQAGEYTKHYYNGTERICSRLGEQQIPISVDNNQELEAYQHDVKQILYNSIGQHLYEDPTDMQEGDLIPLEFLQATGDNNAVFYYHPNHLSSTMYVTDMQQSVVQCFLYAPYGEIISEYNTHAMGEAFPKYSFNAKELDEETGFYYYEARYYAPPTFTSRDPLFEKYFWMTPYAYCANNPVKYVDPTGKWPTKQISGGKVTRQFSNTKKTHPITGTQSRHLGVDFAVPTGTKVYSAAAGTVIFTGYQYNKETKTGYGYYIDIQHENGYVTRYAHLSKIEVKVNDVIADGTQIGLSGASGGVTGPHLHFEIKKNGEKIDPLTINDLQTQINFENFTPILLKEVIVTDIAPDFELINPQIDMNKKYLEKALKQIIDDFKQNLNTNEK